jgi:hypothetical protein
VAKNKEGTWAARETLVRASALSSRDFFDDMYVELGQLAVVQLFEFDQSFPTRHCEAGQLEGK